MLVGSYDWDYSGEIAGVRCNALVWDTTKNAEEGGEERMLKRGGYGDGDKGEVR